MRSGNETSHRRFHAKGAFGMRAANMTRLLILGGCLGCYVQPYNPPPAQVGQTQQPAPYDQTQPPPDQQPPPQPGYAEQQPPPAPPRPPPAAPPPASVYTGPTYDNVTVDVTGSNVPSIDVFYNDLAPYGSWYNDPNYSWVFAQ